jgi:hypothetical protein
MSANEAGLAGYANFYHTVLVKWFSLILADFLR